MIRIIHYCPSINCTSGIANLIMNYYRKIDKNCFQFEFIYFTKKTKNNFEKEINKLGGNSTYIEPPTKILTFIKKLNIYLKTIKKKWPNDKFIFQNHQLAFTVFMYKIIKKNGIDNIIVHNHMTKFSDSKIKSFRNMILFIPTRYMKVKYFSCSKNACKLLCKYAKIDIKDIFIMNNGIDCKRYKYSETTRNNTRNELQLLNSFVIGHIGHFEPVKNHKFILKLFDKIYSINKNSKLLLIGNGSLKNDFIEIINNKPYKNNVIILSERNDIPKLLNGMDCFIFPSKFEGLGIVAIEAQANGLPVIISEGVPTEVSIINCNQIPLINIDEWVNRITNLEKNDRVVPNKIIQDTYFNINKNIDFLEKKYLNIVNIDKRVMK